MELVKCDKLYWDFVLSLRNQMKDSFGNRNIIPLNDHLSFMEQNHSNYRIALKDGKPIGFVGHVEGDIRFAVSIDYQNKGFGKKMVSQFLKEFNIKDSKVRVWNKPSIKLLESCGFVKEYYVLSRK